MKKTTNRRLALRRDIVKSLSVDLRYVKGGDDYLPTPNSNRCTCFDCQSGCMSGCSECKGCTTESEVV